MKRVLSLLVVLAMMVSMIPNMAAAKTEIDLDELLGNLIRLTSIDEISLELSETQNKKIFRWTPAESGVLSVSFYDREWPEGTEIDIAIYQGENSITYSKLDEDTPFELAVVAGQEATILVTKTSETALSTILYGTLTPPVGTQGNPVTLMEMENKVKAEGTLAGAETWFQAYFSGTVMTVAGTGEFSVTANGETTAATEGVVTMPVVTANPRMPFLFAIDQVGEYTISFAYPVGSYMNPEALNRMQIINVNIPAGAAQGYYYQWIANNDSTLRVTCPDVGVGYDVILTNQNTYAMAWLSDSTDGTVSVAVNAGDEVIIQVVTIPDAQWAYPALVTTLTATDAAPVSMTLTADKTDVSKGDVVTFTVSVDKVEQFRSAAFMLVDAFDLDVFEFVTGSCVVTEGVVLNDFGTIGGKLGGTVALKSAADFEGTLFTFQLKVKDAAPYGVTAVSGTPAVRNAAGSLEVTTNAVELSVACVDHNWDAGKVTTEATCAEEGVKTFACTICGATKTEAIEKVAHTEKTEVTKEATCAEEGVKTTSCSVCSEVLKTEAIEKIAHTEKTEVTKEATCAEEGVKTTSCSVCSEVIKTEAIEKIAHTEKTEVTKEATCAEEGVKTTSCSVCSEVLKTETIAKTEDHTYGDWTDNGENHKHTCAVCGKEETEAHTFDTTVWVTDDENHWHACSCGGKQDLQAHSFTEQIVDEAHKVPGEALYYYDCEHCDVMGKETFSVNFSVDSDDDLDVDDAIYLLQYVLMPEMFPVEINPDVDKNGDVNVDDAIYLLQHVLMPDLFPL